MFPEVVWLSRPVRLRQTGAYGSVFRSRGANGHRKGPSWLRRNRDARTSAPSTKVLVITGSSSAIIPSCPSNRASFIGMEGALQTSTPTNGILPYADGAPRRGCLSRTKAGTIHSRACFTSCSSSGSTAYGGGRTPGTQFEPRTTSGGTVKPSATGHSRCADNRACRGRPVLPNRPASGLQRGRPQARLILGSRCTASPTRQVAGIRVGSTAENSLVFS